MILSKFLSILLIMALLFAVVRALLNPQRRKILHENMTLIAKILLMVVAVAASMAFYRRYF